MNLIIPISKLRLNPIWVQSDTNPISELITICFLVSDPASAIVLLIAIIKFPIKKSSKSKIHAQMLDEIPKQSVMDGPSKEYMRAAQS